MRRLESLSRPSTRRRSGRPASRRSGGYDLALLRASLVSIGVNPKAAVFAISFLPQFPPRHDALLPTVLVLATIQVALDTLYCSGILLLADRARRLLERRMIRRRIERGLGLVLVGLGCELALEATRR